MLVAIPMSQSTAGRFYPRARVYLTIANLHLHRRVALGDIFDASHNLRHDGGGCGRATTEMVEEELGILARRLVGPI